MYLTDVEELLVTTCGTAQPTTRPSRMSDNSMSRGNSALQTWKWMNLACRPYLTIMEAVEDPLVSVPSRNTKPHDSDTCNQPKHLQYNTSTQRGLQCNTCVITPAIKEFANMKTNLRTPRSTLNTNGCTYK